jgi:hypothetical protein
MRDEILNYLRSQNLGVITVTTELPWSENGQELYLKNLKKVYVDRDNVEVVPLVATLDAVKISTEVTTVSVYLGCDAKVLPPNLDQAIAVMRLAKDITTINGVNRRDCDVITSFEGDVLVTQLDFRFTKLIT